jgi:hypothetical protein
MQRFILLASLGVFASLLATVQPLYAADFSNASLKGSTACVGSGTAMVTANGKTTPAPLSSLFHLIADGNGNWTGGTMTSNVAGMVCTYAVGTGSTYSVKSDGTGTSIINGTGAASNPAQCAPTLVNPASFVNFTQTSGFAIGTGANGTAWAVCERQRP